MTDIVITLTVKEPKKTGRPIVVSAAPAGEMPLMLSGQFADRHALVDQAFAALLKRKPKVVKVAGEKSQEKKSPAPEKSQTPPKGEEFDDEPAEPETVEAPAPELERKCRVCGCTDEHACEGGCTWVEADLCSACVGKEKPDPLVRSESEVQLPLPVIEGDTSGGE